jgi:Flp pilus assembly protein TadD
MNRILVRTATVAFGALLSAGCATTGNTQAAKSATLAPQAADAPAPVQSLAANLDTQIKNAQDQRAKGDLAGALNTLTQLMLVAPDDARVVGEYGKVLAQRGKSDDAIAFLKRAVELNSSDWTYFSALGVAYDEANDRANAKAAYQQALVLKPGEPVVLNNMAVSDMMGGDYEGAKKLLQQASAAGSTDPRIGQNLQKIASLQGAGPQTAEVQPMKPVEQAAKPVAKPAPVAVATLPAPNVVMQKVPTDPKAGPVATRDPRKLATDAAKPADKKSPQAPKLRTAAD